MEKIFSNRVEKMAIKAIDDTITDKCPLLVANILSNDKTPLFDGNILIYRTINYRNYFILSI